MIFISKSLLSTWVIAILIWMRPPLPHPKIIGGGEVETERRQREGREREGRRERTDEKSKNQRSKKDERETTTCSCMKKRSGFFLGFFFLHPLGS
jgi:hypothetical protein